MNFFYDDDMAFLNRNQNILLLFLQTYDMLVISMLTMQSVNYVSNFYQ